MMFFEHSRPHEHKQILDTQHWFFYKINIPCKQEHYNLHNLFIPQRKYMIPLSTHELNTRQLFQNLGNYY